MALTELEEKTERITELLDRENLGAVLLNAQHNFAWLTGGSTNGIDLSRENGAASLLVTRSGKRYLLANNIELPRMLAEEVSADDFEPVDFSWQEEKAVGDTALRKAKALADGEITTDISLFAGAAAIEGKIKELAVKARDGKLSIDEMTGGTFTITNGGVFGSMLSTPILNPPQSAILGMHNIVERPVAVNGQVVIRPIMYVALSYDHRIIDGKESVSFLMAVKQMIEDPDKMVFGGKDPGEVLLGL